MIVPNGGCLSNFNFVDKKQASRLPTGTCVHREGKNITGPFTLMNFKINLCESSFYLKKSVFVNERKSEKSRKN